MSDSNPLDVVVTGTPIVSVSALVAENEAAPASHLIAPFVSLHHVVTPRTPFRPYLQSPGQNSILPNSFILAQVSLVAPMIGRP